MRFTVAAAFAVLLLSAAGTRGSELVDSDLSPEEVVDRLKEVRQGWEEVEIEFALFERRSDFDGLDSRITHRGKFVVLTGGCGECETFPVDEQGQKQNGEPDDRFVWTPDEFQIHSPGGHIEAISRAELRRIKKGETAERARTELKPVSLAQVIAQCYVSLWAGVFGGVARNLIQESPKDCLPLVYAEDAEVLAERFDLTVMEDDEYIFLFARPIRLEDQRNYQQTAICIDRETFIPIGKRSVLPGPCYNTWVVTSLRVNGEEVEAAFSHGQ